MVSTTTEKPSTGCARSPERVGGAPPRDKPITVEPPFTWRIEAHADHLRIFQAGTLTEGGARKLAAEVDEARRTHRLRLALFDNRAAIEPDDATRAFLWSIALPERFDAVAILMNTPTNLSAPPAPPPIPVRPFDSETHALDWLRRQSIPPPKAE